MSKELVFGIDEKYLVGLEIGKDLSFEGEGYLFHALRTGYFRERNSAENDPTFKQIIPYAVILNKEEDSFFSYTRSGSEGRLHNLISVGIGGHINPIDFQSGLMTTLLNNLQREIGEEVNLSGCSVEDLRLVGPEVVIYDSSSQVNKVHLGLLYYCFLPEGVTLRMSSEGKEGKFRTHEELKNSYNSLETWSKIVLPFLG